MAKRRPVVGVMGGADVDTRALVEAEELGRLIAERGWILLNGGRNAGVMGASARGAKSAGGMVVGILPDRDDARAAVDLDLVIRTGMRDARNVINVLSSDVVVACPGGAGTLSEIALAVKNNCPVVIIGDLDASALAPFVRPGQVVMVRDAYQAVAQVEAMLA